MLNRTGNNLMQTATAPIVVSAAMVTQLLRVSDCLAARGCGCHACLSFDFWGASLYTGQSIHTHKAHKADNWNYKHAPTLHFLMDAASTRVQIWHSWWTHRIVWLKQTEAKQRVHNYNNESQCHGNGHLNAAPEFNKTSASVSHGQDNSSRRASKS